MTGPSVVLAALLAATPEPGEILDTPPEELITPGTIGFLVTFGVAVALVLLVRDMTRRTRRIQVRSELADEQLRREQAGRAEREAGQAGQADPTDPTDSTDPTDPTDPPDPAGGSPITRH